MTSLEASPNRYLLTERATADQSSEPLAEWGDTGGGGNVPFLIINMAASAVRARRPPTRAGGGMKEFGKRCVREKMWSVAVTVRPVEHTDEWETSGG